MAIEAKDFIL